MMLRPSTRQIAKQKKLQARLLQPIHPRRLHASTLLLALLPPSHQLKVVTLASRYGLDIRHEVVSELP